MSHLQAKEIIKTLDESKLLENYGDKAIKAATKYVMVNDNTGFIIVLVGKKIVLIPWLEESK